MRAEEYQKTYIKCKKTLKVTVDDGLCIKVAMAKF